MTREWPILFSAPLVRANRAGRKSQTRRLSPRWAEAKPGDVLYVRETWRAPKRWDSRKPSEIYGDEPIWYEADGAPDTGYGKLRPSIFLPRWASRDTYVITSVRQERLQDISDEDARAEGLVAWRRDDESPVHYGIEIPDVWETDPRATYRRLWDEINGKTAPWSSNPIVYPIAYDNPAAAK